MNSYLFLLFFILGILVLLKPLVTYGFKFWLRMPSWRKPALLSLTLAGVCLGYIVSRTNWTEYASLLILFTLACIIIFKSFLVLIIEPVMRGLTSKVLKHYWWFGIPSAAILWCLGIWLLLWSYMGEIEQLQGCDSDQKLQVVCGILNPEDIVTTPDQTFLIIPEFGGIGPYHSPEDRGTGRLMLVSPETGSSAAAHIDFGDNVWGDGVCQRDEGMALSPHGIDLKQRTNGKWQLAVINHHPRETIEIYELIEDKEEWKLVWRGCVTVPPANYLNDVSLSSDGSFYVSHMYDHSFTVNDALMAAFLKHNTGYVMRWDKDLGFSEVPGTEGSHPNGIVYDEVNGLLYVAHTFGDRIDAVDMSQGKVISSYNINSPDNLVLRYGALWSTSWDHSIPDMAVCEDKSPCALPFSVYKLKPKTLQLDKRWLFNHTIIGLGTVAFPLKDQIWIGTARGDRLAFFEQRD